MHVFRRVEHDARADAVRRILHHRHIEPQAAQRRHTRRQQDGQNPALSGKQLFDAEHSSQRAKRRAEQRAEQMAHAHARHAQRQQRPAFLVPSEHLVQSQQHHREKDHRQTFAQRRACVEIHQPINAQRIKHACADGGAAAAHQAAHAQITGQRRRQIDARLKHPHARAQRYAQIAQRRRKIEKQFGIKFRRGIAVAQQGGAVNAHGELAVSQAACNALDSVQVKQQIMAVIYAAPEQRHAGKRRRADEDHCVPAVFAPAFGFIP